MSSTTVHLTADNADHHLEVIAPDGRVLLITVGIPALDWDEEDNGQPAGPREEAFVVHHDTPEWEPTTDHLRLNVNDGPVWNYADEGTGAYEINRHR